MGLDFVFVALAAATASCLTMFTGFGLGTLLLPVFALFLPVDIAVAATALVHGANSILKTALLGRWADRWVVLRFGLPAIIAAFAGVYALKLLSGMPTLWSYTLGAKEAMITPLKLVMALLMAGFAIVELHPWFDKWQVERRWLPLGGVLSGFFGGLSGHQGALRSAFLVKLGMSPEAFVGTNAVIGLLVDLVRIGGYATLLYGSGLAAMAASRQGALVAVGAAAAFTGVLLGKRFLHKVTMNHVQRVTGALLLVIAVLLGAGLV